MLKLFDTMLFNIIRPVTADTWTNGAFLLKTQCCLTLVPTNEAFLNLPQQSNLPRRKPTIDY